MSEPATTFPLMFAGSIEEGIKQSPVVLNPTSESDLRFHQSRYPQQSCTPVSSSGHFSEISRSELLHKRCHVNGKLSQCIEIDLATFAFLARS